MTHPFRFAVYAHTTTSGAEWADFARRVEALGYSSLLVPDHFLNLLAPVPALAAAAAATSTLRLGGVVFANDYKHPAVLAKEAAMIDLLSGGRFECGLGAGWLQKEYDQAGIPFDPPGVRLARMEEGITVLRGLWGPGPFSFSGTYFTIRGLDGLPKPVQQPHPPLFIGGTGPRMLRLAGREADIAGVLPQTLPQGGHDWLGSTEESLARKIGFIREGAGDRFGRIELSAVGYIARVTETPETVAADHAPGLGLTVDQLLASPDFLIGPETALVDRLLAQRERHGISYLEIPAGDMEAFAPIVKRLSGR